MDKYQIIIDFINYWKDKQMQYFQELKQEKSLLQTSNEWYQWYHKTPKQHQEMLSRGDKEIARIISRDAENRLLDIIEKIENKSGNVISVSLYPNQKFGFDGYIHGDKAKIYIETIGAGGYNVQVFHYRTLIKVVKK